MPARRDSLLPCRNAIFGPTLPVTRHALALVLARGTSAAARGGSAALRAFLAAALVLGVAVARPLASQACGPFTDVGLSDPYCADILRIYYMGLTAGTSPTTFGPTQPVTRQVVAALLARASAGAGTAQANRRAALDQFWVVGGTFGRTTVGANPVVVKSDGADLWVANNAAPGTVSRVRASDGKLLETWTGAAQATGVLAAAGSVFVTGAHSPGSLYRIDPSQPAGAVSTVATVGGGPVGIAFDGYRIWTANTTGSVSIVTPGPDLPWSVTPAAGSFTSPYGLVFDGAYMWVTDYAAGQLLKLDGNGAILQTVTVGGGPQLPAFDGANIWVPNNGSDSVSVVRAATGEVVATLTGNGLNEPAAAAFDGQRVLVTNFIDSSVSLFRAANLSPVAAFGLGASSFPIGVCSDGINFWIAAAGAGQLIRF